MRRLDEEIYVRTVTVRDPAAVATECPDRFVWDNRLYLVQLVLAAWRERRTWWREHDAGADERPADRFVWRVQARAGACAAPGVYELVREPGRTVGGGRDSEHVGGSEHAGGGAHAGEWRLTRVLD